jgi:hypothetical protein
VPLAGDGGGCKAALKVYDEAYLHFITDALFRFTMPHWPQMMKKVSRNALCL